MSDRRQTPLNWNLNDPLDRETMEWLEKMRGDDPEKKGNVSGIIKRIVFEYIERQKAYEYAKNLVKLQEQENWVNKKGAPFNQSPEIEESGMDLQSTPWDD